MILKKNKQGFMLTEMMVSMAVLALLMSSFAIALGGFRSINHFYMSKQRCIAAARAQLERISVTGKALADDDFKNLWPRVEFSIDKSQGAGQWQGLTLVSVTTRAKTTGRHVEVQLARYIRLDEGD